MKIDFEKIFVPMEHLRNKISPGYRFSEEEIREIFSSGINELDFLFEISSHTRKLYKGDKINLRGLIEISNYCDESCPECDFSSSNDSIERFRLTTDEILSEAKSLIRSGIKTIVLHSGNDKYFDKDMISHIIYNIKQISDVNITLCLGERSFEEYKAWKYAGADRYILRHESLSNLSLTGFAPKNFDNRLEHFRYLKELKYSTGKMSYLGIPGQSTEDIIKDILLINDLDLDVMIFIPKYIDKILGMNTYLNSVKANAIAKIMNPGIDLVLASNIFHLNESQIKLALDSGINTVLFRMQKNCKEISGLDNFVIDSEGSITTNYIKLREILDSKNLQLVLDKKYFSNDYQVEF